MKKKLLTILLLCALSISFTACGKSTTESNAKTETSENQIDTTSDTNKNSESDTFDSEEREDTQQDTKQEDIPNENGEEISENLDALGDIDVDEGIFNVKMTIPAEYVGDSTQEDLNKIAEENGYKSVILNEDGSATYQMTKKQHKELLSEYKEQIENSLNEMVASEDYPNFTKIESNNNFSEFTVTTKSTELDMNESFSVMTFYMYGGLYSIFSGEDVDNVSVTFINADSGEVIETANSSDMGESE